MSVDVSVTSGVCLLGGGVCGSIQLYSLHLRLHLRGVRLFGARPPLRIAVLAPIAAEELPLVAAGSVGVTR